MYSKRFEKETFKEAVRENVRTLYRKNIAEASPQQIFQAVSYAVKDIIMDDWIVRRRLMMKQMQRPSTICPWSF